MMRVSAAFVLALALAVPARAAGPVTVYDADGTDVRLTLPPGACTVDGDTPAEARLRVSAGSATGARQLALLFVPCAERDRLRGDAQARAQAYGHVGLFGTPADAMKRYAPLPVAPPAKSLEWLETRLALLDLAMRGPSDEPAASLSADGSGSHLLVLRKDAQNRLTVEIHSVSLVAGFVFHIREFLPHAEPAVVFAALQARRDWVRALQDLNAGS